MTQLSELLDKRPSQPLDLHESSEITDITSTGTFPVNPISCQWKSRITLKPSFSVNTVTANIRITFFDLSNVAIGDSEILMIQNTNLSNDDGRYQGSTYTIANELGASGIKIVITTAPITGNLKIAIVATT